jgi:hypothetical protein
MALDQVGISLEGMNGVSERGIDHTKSAGEGSVSRGFNQPLSSEYT